MRTKSDRIREYHTGLKFLRRHAMHCNEFTAFAKSAHGRSSIKPRVSKCWLSVSQDINNDRDRAPQNRSRRRDLLGISNVAHGTSRIDTNKTRPHGTSPDRPGTTKRF